MIYFDFILFFIFYSFAIEDYGYALQILVTYYVINLIKFY